MQGLSRLLPSLRVSHLVAGLACVICFVAGYLLAGSWSDANDTTPLEQICARVDHVKSLEMLFAAVHRLPSHMLAHYIGCQLGRGVENVLPEARVSVEQP